MKVNRVEQKARENEKALISVFESLGKRPHNFSKFCEDLMEQETRVHDRLMALEGKT